MTSQFYTTLEEGYLGQVYTQSAELLSEWEVCMETYCED